MYQSTFHFTQKRDGLTFINLDDAWQLSRTSAGFEKAFCKEVLTRVASASAFSPIVIKYGAFDWGDTCNVSAYNLLLSILERINAKPRKPKVMLLLPAQKPYLLSKLQRVSPLPFLVLPSYEEPTRAAA